VLPDHRLDALIRPAGTPGFTGDDVYGGSGRQRVTATTAGGEHGRASAVVRVENDGSRRERYTMSGESGNDLFRVEYHFPGAGRGTTVLEPGESRTFRVTVIRRSAAEPGDVITIEVAARSARHPGADDAVAIRVRAAR
jgi:uncharacterized membrane protein